MLKGHFDVYIEIGSIDKDVLLNLQLKFMHVDTVFFLNKL